MSTDAVDVALLSADAELNVGSNRSQRKIVFQMLYADALLRNYSLLRSYCTFIFTVRGSDGQYCFRLSFCSLFAR